MKHNLNSENRYIGIEGIDLSNYLSDREKGIKVESVKSNTLAAKIGFKKDDIIIGVNQQLVVNIEELKKFWMLSLKY